MEVLRNSEEDFKKPCSKSNPYTKPAFDNVDHSLTKENLSPCVAGSTLPFTHSSQIRLPLRSNSVIGNLPDTTPGKSITSSFESQEHRCYETETLDSEIEAIEKEITRLSSRLEYLRLEKAKQIQPVKTAAEKRGRFVPAKFMDPPPPSLFSEKQNPRMITPRSRGLSMVPSEIARGLTMAATATPVGRRGISLGPAEIYSATRSKLLAKQQAFTPIYQSQSRRKSCFWKLQEVDELKVIKERGKSMSMSPKSRKIASKLQSAYPKQALTSLGAAKNKSVKKDDTLISSIQPKKLFKDNDKSAQAKKPLKSGRTVASRYNKSSGNVTDSSNSAASSSVRKRSLPENDKEIKICDKKRISLSGKSEAVSEISSKQSEISGDDPLSVTVELEMLPKIRTLQCLIDSPRDSGPAKRVVELVKRRSHFSLEEDERDEIEEVQPASACKALSFEDEEEEEEEEETINVKECPTIKSILRIHGSGPRE